MGICKFVGDRQKKVEFTGTLAADTCELKAHQIWTNIDKRRNHDKSRNVKGGYAERGRYTCIIAWIRCLGNQRCDKSTQSLLAQKG